MPQLEAPTIASLLTVIGNAAVVTLLVTLIKRTLALSAAQVDRFGPLLAIGCGVALAVLAGLITGLTREDLAQAALTGFASGALSMGLYSLAGNTVQSIASSVTGGRVAPPGAW